MNKQDLMKIQTCVLRVNIHCEGCMHKVKKKLQKVEGVYKVNIDEAQGKVTVSGNVDPLLLIEKLEKAGKHAELWGPQKGQGPIPMSNNFQFGKMKDGKGQKGGFQVPQGKAQNGGFQIPQGKAQNGGFQIPQGKGQNGGFQMPPELQAQMQMLMNQKKGVKDEKHVGKDQKSVKFKLPEEDEEDDYEDSDDYDDDDDDYDDESDEEFAHQPPAKVAPGGHGQQAKKAPADGHSKGDKNGGKSKKKGGGINMLFKSMLGKAGGKNGGKKGESKSKDSGKDGKKNGGGDGKNGAANGKGAPKNGGGKGNNKKGGEEFDLGFKMEGKPKGFGEMNANHKGGGGGGNGGGRNMDMMGQMGSFPAVQGLPAMNGGRMQGMGQGNPYNQQQHMAQMMMMNGQNAYNRPHPQMGYGPPQTMGYGPPQTMGYGPPPQAMGYGPPPPPGDHYTNMFNDENTDSCSIM